MINMINTLEGNKVVLEGQVIPANDITKVCFTGDNIVIEYIVREKEHTEVETEKRESYS